MDRSLSEFYDERQAYHASYDTGSHDRPQYLADPYETASQQSQASSSPTMSYAASTWHDSRSSEEYDPREPAGEIHDANYDFVHEQGQSYWRLKAGVSVTETRPLTIFHSPRLVVELSSSVRQALPAR